MNITLPPKPAANKFTLEMSPENGEFPHSRYRFSQSAELMRDIRLAQSLSQLIKVLTHTLPGLLDASVCGYLTWVTSPQFGVHWETVFGENAEAFQKSAPTVDAETAHSFKSGEAKLVTRGMSDSPHNLEGFMTVYEMFSLMLLPIYLEDNVRGVLVLGRASGRRPWSETELEAGNEVVQLAITMYAMRNELAQTQVRVKELERVFSASLDLTATLNLEDVLNSILKNALSLFQAANDAHIFYYDGNNLSFGAAMFQDGSTGKVWALPRLDGLTMTVAKTGEMIVVENMRTHPLYNNTPSTWKGGIVGLPLKMKGNVVGVMTLAVLEPYIFPKSKLHQLRLLADQAGIAIQNARLHDLLREEAQTDWLTDLPNRRAFETTLGQFIEHADTFGGSFTLMMVDLNHFKSINDTYGHRVGDDALRIIAHRLRDGVRKTDFLARIGGDEFVVLFPGTSIDDAYAIGIHLQEFVSVCDLQLPDGKVECISISFGLANYPDTAHTPAELLEAADTGLYLDKDRT
jgi:diguanylate cyclase (GGDEF)-like protein